MSGCYGTAQMAWILFLVLILLFFGLGGWGW